MPCGRPRASPTKACSLCWAAPPCWPAIPICSEDVLTTTEVDLWPASLSEESAAVLECIGEQSAFDQTHGFYVDPFNPANALLLAGWQERVIAHANENTHGCVGLCLEKHDLIVSKLARGEPKDLRFTLALLDYGLLDVDTLRTRIALVDPEQPHYQQTGESPDLDVRGRIRANLQRVLGGYPEAHPGPSLPGSSDAYPPLPGAGATLPLPPPEEERRPRGRGR